ncbi:Protein NETWORKED 4A [Vitis vinifera]|uniref:Protein NETWORKED 4A n=1 Tax=Vitis vinifera TaxID=29760 RepID=A0A438F956_VITVI|nr:Protein NETWORKED 4A [Vitis vinifera]
MGRSLLKVKSQKNLKRTESKKSHSWWWDSHISPKNSKWLADNLEETDKRVLASEMDQSVKRMLKLIEEDGDSFAKKAEMYYQKRPELISHVEDFYRIYRSLAERYDHVTGELRKNILSDLQSQGSGISDLGSEPASTCPSPDQRERRRKSGRRAAGFDFFLGSGGSSSDLYNKGDESSSLSDSESGSDDSSVNNYLGVPGKQQMQQEENADRSLRGTGNGNCEDLLGKIAGYEEELRAAKEKIQLSEEEIVRLKTELQKYGPLNFTNNFQAELVELPPRDIKMQESELEFAKKQASEFEERAVGLEVDCSDPGLKIQSLVEELRITKERLQGSEKEIANLIDELASRGSSESISHMQEQLELAHKDIAMWKAKLDREKREVSKLQERVGRYKTSLSDREHEIRELKEVISDADHNFELEKSLLMTKISKLLDNQSHLEEKLKEWELRCQSLEEEIKQVDAEKTETKALLEEQEKLWKTKIEQLKADTAESGDRINDLNKSLDALKLKHDTLMSERDELSARVHALISELSSRDDQKIQMDKYLHQLRIEQAELVAGAEEARRLVEELRSKAKQLEEEVERQKGLVSEAAEEKREAIRQLCFSLDHYRNGYNRLRQAFTVHKRPAVLTS